MELVAKTPQDAVVFVSTALSLASREIARPFLFRIDRNTLSDLKLCTCQGHWWGDKVEDFLGCLEHYAKAKEFKQVPSLQDDSMMHTAGNHRTGWSQVMFEDA